MKGRMFFSDVWSVSEIHATGPVSSTDWKTYWLTGWLPDWICDWLPGRQTVWLAGWVRDWLAVWLTDWLIGWLADWLAGYLADFVADCLAERVIDCLANWLADWLTDRVANWLDWVRFSWLSNNSTGIWRWVVRHKLYPEDAACNVNRTFSAYMLNLTEQPSRESNILVTKYMSFYVIPYVYVALLEQLTCPKRKLNWMTLTVQLTQIFLLRKQYLFYKALHV